MGPLTVDKADHIFWLGRYVERVFTMLRDFYEYSDDQVDENPNAYRELSARLGLFFDATDADAFYRRLLFDLNEPLSISSSMNCAFDNAVLLRGELTSENLSYIELAHNQLRRSQKEVVAYVSHRKVADFLLAFWGSIADSITNEQVESILNTGKYLERVDLYARLRHPDGATMIAIEKLGRYMQHISVGARFDLRPAFEGVIQRARLDDGISPDVVAALLHTYYGRWPDEDDELATKPSSPADEDEITQPQAQSQAQSQSQSPPPR